MSGINAFATPEYPVLFSVLAAEDAEASVPPGHVGISLALLVDGMPTFLATHVVADDRVNAVVGSLEEGDVRLAVVGLSVELDDETPTTEEPGSAAEHPAAVISVVCADGRRLVVARILGRDASRSPGALARYVIREITRGVQIPELASAR